MSGLRIGKVPEIPLISLAMWPGWIGCSILYLLNRRVHQLVLEALGMRLVLASMLITGALIAW